MMAARYGVVVKDDNSKLSMVLIFKDELLPQVEKFKHLGVLEAGD